MTIRPAREALGLHFARAAALPHDPARRSELTKWVWRVVAPAGLAAAAYAAIRMGQMLAALSSTEAGGLARGAGATFLRVEVTLVLAGLWTIPAGVFVGLRRSFPPWCSHSRKLPPPFPPRPCSPSSS